MKNIIYVRVGIENKIVELEEFGKLVCVFVKPPMKQGTWLNRWQFYRDLKKMAKQLEKLLDTNGKEEIVVESRLLEIIEQNKKWKKIFLFLSDYPMNMGIHEAILRLFVSHGHGQERWNHLEELVMELPRQEILTDALEECVMELVELLHPTLNYLTIISDNTEKYEDLAQRLCEETGLLLQCIEEKKQLETLQKNKKWHRGRKSLWIDLNDVKVNYRCVPRDCIYFDANGQKEKARTLGVKRRDVSYVSPVKFLDTLVDHIV